VNEPVSDRKREECWARLDDEVTELLNDLDNELCSAKTLAVPREPVKYSDRPFVWEVAVDSESVKVLKREFFSAMLDAEVSDPDKDLNNEDRSLKPEPRVSEPLSDRNREFFSARIEAMPRESVRSLPTPFAWKLEEESEAVRDRKTEFFSANAEVGASDPFSVLKIEFFSLKLELTINVLVRDLKSEFFSASPEKAPTESLRSLLTPLVWEVARESEPVRLLNREFFSASAEAVAQVAVRVAEHERGLELQVNCPESTLATMLPIAMEIESARVLKMAFFSEIEEARATELLSVLKIELCSTKDEAVFSMLVRDLKREFFSAIPEPIVREPLTPWTRFHPGVITSEAVETVVSVAVQQDPLPTVVCDIQYSIDMKWILENGPTLPVV
jgi:hypothetical protein